MKINFFIRKRGNDSSSESGGRTHRTSSDPDITGMMERTSTRVLFLTPQCSSKMVIQVLEFNADLQ